MTLDPELVQLARPMVAQILLQVLSRMRAGNGEAHVPALPRELLGKAHPDPVAAPVGDEHAPAGIGAALEHGPGIEHVRVLCTLDLGAVGNAAGRDDDGLGLLALDRLGGNRRVEHYLDAGARKLLLQVSDKPSKLRSLGQKLRQQYLAAQARPAS